MAREVLGIAGAWIGGTYGGWAGAQIGYMVGSYIGGLIDPVTTKGPGLTEAPVQTSRDGIPIPIIWGLHHCHGNIIIKNPEVQITTTTSQGKGGGTEVEETRRFRTFGIGICRGPISEVTRIWENERLVYDMRAVPALPLAETTAYAENIVIYLGDEAQLPDPELEGHWGVGTTPAFRGLAYIVWVDKDLTDFGGAIPQYRFEINGSRDLSVTSRPYPIGESDGIRPIITFPDAAEMVQPIDAIEIESTPEDGNYGATLISYSWAEAIEVESTPVDGSYGATLTSYSWEEAIEVESTPVDGTYGSTLVSYSWEEAIEVTSVPVSGDLV